MTTAPSRLNLLTLIDRVMSFIPSVCKSHLSLSLSPTENKHNRDGDLSE